MKKLLLLLSLFLILGCAKDEEVVPELEQVFEISLDGVQFDPYERYSLINTYGAVNFSLRPPVLAEVSCVLIFQIAITLQLVRPSYKHLPV